MMEAVRQSWTDDRMDDLNGKVDAMRIETKTEFAAVRGEMKDGFAAVRGEMKEGFDKIDGRFDKIDARFERIDERFEALHRLLVQFCGILIVALIGFIATQV